eukprot:scaffold42800_cov52-Attheya_sp.AAC.7
MSDSAVARAVPRSPVASAADTENPISSSPSTAVNLAMSQLASVRRTKAAAMLPSHIPTDGGGFEDLNAFWTTAVAATRTAAAAEASSQQQQPQDEEKKSAPVERKAKAQPERHPPTVPDFQLDENAHPNVPSADATADATSTSSSIEVSEKLSQMVRRNIEGSSSSGNKAGGLLFSPSDMSRVSTVPPTPWTSTSVMNDNGVSPEIAEEEADDQSQDEESLMETPTQIIESQEEDAGDFSPSPRPSDGGDALDLLLRQRRSQEEKDASADATSKGPVFRESMEAPVLEEGADEFLASVDQLVQDEDSEPHEQQQEQEQQENFDVDNNDDDDDTNDGPGFEMADASPLAKEESPPPASVKSKASKRKKKLEPITKKRKKGVELSPKRRSKKKVTYATPDGYNKGYPVGNREYEAVPVTDYKDDDDDEAQQLEGGVRRSKRARFPPLQYWKNERLMFEANNESGILGEAMGDMPVVSGVLSALPTPYKQRKVVEKKKKKKQYSSPNSDDDDDESRHRRAELSPFDSRKLRKKYDIKDGETAQVWDDISGDIAEEKFVAYADSMHGTQLPLSSSRTKAEGKVVGKAGQAFNIAGDEEDVYVGYISGNLELPPRGIKDAEGVGGCNQVFTVCRCQPKSLEIALGHPDNPIFSPKTAQRFLLSAGDIFRVPPGNTYRIQNHSKVESSMMTWTIIKPRRNQSEEK